jgi:hypothetical protein
MSLGSGIQDPGSGKNLLRIQGSKRHRITDPGSGIRNTDSQDAFFLGNGQSCALTITVEEYEAYEHE